MIFNAAGILIFLSLYGIVASNPAVDCRKFVFAPLCRGVAAKRDLFTQHKIIAFPNEESTKQLLRSLYAAMTSSEDEQNYSSGATHKENVEENMAKTYQPEQMNRLLKLLFENRSKSERDNFLGQEFENLVRSVGFENKD